MSLEERIKSDSDPSLLPQNRDKVIQIPVTVEGKPAEHVHPPTDVRAERDQYLDHLQRLQAEFSNYRKRVDKERESLSAWVKGDLLIKILPILDDAELLVRPPQKDPAFCQETVRMIVRNFKKVLEEEGLEEIVVQHGESFNPEIHDAVSVQAASPESDGRIVEVWRKGYRFKNRLLRPSHVKVGKARDRKDGTEPK